MKTRMVTGCLSVMSRGSKFFTFTSSRVNLAAIINGPLNSNEKKTEKNNWVCMVVSEKSLSKKLYVESYTFSQN